jgi:hypothetical protein
MPAESSTLRACATCSNDAARNTRFMDPPAARRAPFLA